MTKRQIGSTDIFVSSVAMGCWPITGITSIDVTHENSIATLQAAREAGINFFDTAYIYGYEGESEQMIATALGDYRDEIVIASKCGLHWDANHQQVRDARPERILQECEASLRRLNTDRIDLYYLHAPDPNVPLADSAGAIKELLDAGKIRAAGVSNFLKIEQYEEFNCVCPISADQPHYNMLQREIESERLPWCRAHHVSVFVYWPLMKGFLAGKLKRDHTWDSKDGRQKYPIFVGEEWTKTHDFVDQLLPLAAEMGITLAQLAVAWVIQRNGITGALCGAKRPAQIIETAQAMQVTFSTQQLEQIDLAIAERGTLNSRPAVS